MSKAEAKFDTYVEKILEVEAREAVARETVIDHRGNGVSVSKGQMIVKNPRLPGSGVQIMSLKEFEAKFAPKDEPKQRRQRKSGDAEDATETTNVVNLG